jgi:hypothetical protein
MLIILVLFATFIRTCNGLSPNSLRVDLFSNNGPFITLDTHVTGVSSNITFSWGLPSGIALQRASRVWVTTPSINGTNTTVYDSGWVVSLATSWLQAGANQNAGLKRSTLQPASVYDWTVAVRDATGVFSTFATPQRFFTSAGEVAWAATNPIWAPSCNGGGSSPPQFAYFHTSLSIGKSKPAASLISALFYVTGSPPIYNDPWNVTKIAGGYTLDINGLTRGTGPGKAACGPVAMSSCTPVQPYDGFDLTSDTIVSINTGKSINIDIRSYAITQKEFDITPAAQAVFVTRWDDDSVIISGTGSSSNTWYALDADSVVNPSGNKAPFWYTQPREDVTMSCLTDPKMISTTTTSLSSTTTTCSTCGWVSPILISGAFAGAALAGKATQATFINPHHLPASITQLGFGWYILDAGFEIQGGINLVFNTLFDSAPNGAIVLVQLGEEIAANGSARWNLRAGNHYQDRWTFPSTTTPSSSSNIQYSYSHHEFSEFRYAEIIITDASSGLPLDIPPFGKDSAVNVDFWRVHYPYDDKSATIITTSDPDINAVWNMAQFTLKTTTLDIYSDSSTRQRSFDCMADDTTAALSHYSTTSELAFPRFAAAQIMATMNGGYISRE